MKPVQVSIVDQIDIELPNDLEMKQKRDVIRNNNSFLKESYGKELQYDLQH